MDQVLLQDFFEVFRHRLVCSAGLARRAAQRWFSQRAPAQLAALQEVGALPGELEGFFLRGFCFGSGALTLLVVAVSQGHFQIVREADLGVESELLPLFLRGTHKFDCVVVLVVLLGQLRTGFFLCDGHVLA